MPRILTGAVAVYAVWALIIGLVIGSTPVAASHWGGSVTNFVDNDVETQGCHDSPYYFNPIYGWARSCNGGHDVASSPFSPNVYIGGYFWSSATVTATAFYDVYYNSNCTSWAGREYRNAFEITVPTGTAGIAFHHLGNYHYGVGAVLGNGTHIGEQANWGAPVYFCSGQLASTGAHIHAEAARDGVPDDSQLVDAWLFDNGHPFVQFRHP